MRDVVAFMEILRRVAASHIDDQVRPADIDAAIHEFEKREHPLDDKHMPPAKDARPTDGTQFARSFRPTPWTVCVWEDCDQHAIYCEGHADENNNATVRELAGWWADKYEEASGQLDDLRDKLREPLTDEECVAVAGAWADAEHDGYADLCAAICEFLRLRGVVP